MKIYFILKNAFIIFSVFCLLSSCASILNPRYQKITINTDENCTVLIDGKNPDTRSGKYMVERNATSKQILVRKNGAKDVYSSIIQYKKSPYYIMTVVPFVSLLFIPPFYDSFIKSRDYVKEIDLTNKTVYLPDMTGYSHLLKLDSVNIKIDDNNIITRDFEQYSKYVKNKFRKEPVVGSHIMLRELNLIDLKKSFGKLLEDKKYIRESKAPELTINATINSYSYNRIKSFFKSNTAVQSDFGEFLEVALGIKWDVFDGNKNLIFSYNSNNKSGQFAYYDSDTRISTLSNALSDALEYGFIELIKTQEFQKQLENRKELFEVPHSNNETLNSINSQTAMQNTIDTISIINKDDVMYLSKKDMIERAEYQTGAVMKNTLLKFVEDVPELYSFTVDNFNSGKGYASSLISCYNDYKLRKENIKLNQDYYYKFGLITRKEWRSGPSEVMLKLKKPISGQINHMTTITTKHYIYTGQTTSTVGEHYRFKFVYGNAEYKKGFLLRNLKKAIGEDREALKYITKYRLNLMARTTIFGFGLINLYALVRLLETNKTPFGMSEKSTWIVCLPIALVFTNWFNIYPQNYKTRNITKAIDTYNHGLDLKY